MSRRASVCDGPDCPFGQCPLVDTQSWFHARTLQKEWTHFFQNLTHYTFETLLIESPETPPYLPRLVGERHHCRYGIRTQYRGRGAGAR